MTQSAPSPAKSCPTPNADARLRELHYHWHRCAVAYQSAEEFRFSLNAAVQTARNLTFALQAEKANVPQFDEWYSHWRGLMSADPVMRWVNSARVQIVHLKDLETESRTTVRLITDYESAALALPLNADAKVPRRANDTDLNDPLATLDEIRSNRPLGLPLRVWNDATLSVERRWEDKDLPGIELLDALGHAYGILASMLKDLHTRLGLAFETYEDIEGEDVLVDNEGSEGRLPCMATTRKQRTVYVRVRDGSLVDEPVAHRVIPDLESAENAAAKYGLEELRSLRGDSAKSVLDLLPMYIQGATAILAAGEEHGWFAFLFRGMTLVDSRALAARDSIDKRAIADELADIVAMYGVDAVVEVGEIWLAPLVPTVDGSYMAPGAHPERSEALSIWIETAAGGTADVIVPFERVESAGDSPRLVTIGEPIRNTRKQYYLLEPVREVWRARGLRPRYRPGASFFKE